ncbi:serine/threonine-protein kinase LMTK3-like [Patiria miniata]|uniref:Uncharacterized protein n=1 Tax=Patiria miniata TaxID=46514 RepID=A0A914BME6_PATMI|nr:serine/threonine-protein kinase LMTK3-like [Patiria miniata]
MPKSKKNAAAASEKVSGARRPRGRPRSSSASRPSRRRSGAAVSEAPPMPAPTYAVPAAPLRWTATGPGRPAKSSCTACSSKVCPCNSAALDIPAPKHGRSSQHNQRAPSLGFRLACPFAHKRSALDWWRHVAQNLPKWGPPPTPDQEVTLPPSPSTDTTREDPPAGVGGQLAEEGPLPVQTGKGTLPPEATAAAAPEGPGSEDAGSDAELAEPEGGQPSSPPLCWLLGESPGVAGR